MLPAAGIPGSTPAVAVERGTTARQRTVFAQLRDLPERVAAAALASPTLLIIGGVVALAPKWPFGEAAAAEGPAGGARARARARARGGLDSVGPGGSEAEAEAERQGDPEGVLQLPPMGVARAGRIADWWMGELERDPALGAAAGSAV